MNLDELEKLARAATPGPWSWDPDGDLVSADLSSSNAVVIWLIEPPIEQADAAYIAALSPDVVLKLLAVVRAAVAYRKHYPEAYMGDVDNHKHAAREALADAVDALKEQP